MASQSGLVKWYNSEKGYGFIVPDDGGKDVFLHSSDIAASGMTDSVTDGDRVTFDTEPGRNGKGPKAVRIARV